MEAVQVHHLPGGYEVGRPWSPRGAVLAVTVPCCRARATCPLLVEVLRWLRIGREQAIAVVSP